MTAQAPLRRKCRQCHHHNRTDHHTPNETERRAQETVKKTANPHRARPGCKTLPSNSGQHQLRRQKW